MHAKHPVIERNQIRVLPIRIGRDGPIRESQNKKEKTDADTTAQKRQNSVRVFAFELCAFSSAFAGAAQQKK